MNAFDKIYDGNVWGFGSGHGSLPSLTKGYRRFLEGFLAENKIRTVLDYGCGDWQFSRLINWNGVHYTGVDVAQKVIEENRRQFGSDRVTFRVVAPGTADLPAADLLVSKDVLQHLNRDEIAGFLKNILPRYRYALITNCVLPAADVNRDIQTGEFRPLDLRQPPFNLPAEEVFSFSCPRTFVWRQWKFLPGWKKTVLLVKNF